LELDKVNRVKKKMKSLRSEESFNEESELLVEDVSNDISINKELVKS